MKEVSRASHNTSHEFDLSLRSHDVIDHVTIRLAISYFLLVVPVTFFSRPY